MLRLQRDLLTFLINAEKNEWFIHEIRRRIHKEMIPKPGTVKSPYEIERVLGVENTKSLLFFLKDICVRYLGYDSIEKKTSDNKDLIVPSSFSSFREDELTMLNRPRKITTSNDNIHVRFWNYILMDWEVTKISRYLINPLTFGIEEGMGGGVSFQSDADISAEKELASLKKYLKKEDRFPYMM